MKKLRVQIKLLLQGFLLSNFYPCSLHQSKNQTSPHVAIFTPLKFLLASEQNQEILSRGYIPTSENFPCIKEKIKTVLSNPMHVYLLSLKICLPSKEMSGLLVGRYTLIFHYPSHLNMVMLFPIKGPNYKTMLPCLQAL
uniref:Uncharacterized protein n=1 Tax=Cacopsylla melanoneura TaxID=428564 RepID=A0A8D8WZ39_9HEMI